MGSKARKVREFVVFWGYPSNLQPRTFETSEPSNTYNYGKRDYVKE